MHTYEQTAGTFRGAQEDLPSLLDRLKAVLSQPALEPDPLKAAVLSRCAALDEVWSLAHDRIPAAFNAFVVTQTDADEIAGARRVTADVLGDALGTLLAAMRTQQADLVRGQAEDIASGSGALGMLLTEAAAEPTRYVLLIHAWWLLRQGHSARAFKVANSVGRGGEIGRSAGQVLEQPRSISSAPILGTINGVGVRIYGDRDHREDGSFVATRFFTVVYVPVLPLDAYRVSDAHDEGWHFHSKARLSALMRLWQLVALVTLLLGGLFVGVSGYLNRPSHRLAAALEVVQDAADDISSPADRDAVLQQYEGIIAETDLYEGLANEDFKPAVEAWIEIAAAGIPDPLTAGAIGEVDRVLQRFYALPLFAQQPAQAHALVVHLERWGTQLDDPPSADEHEAVVAQLALLEYAVALADTELANRLKDRRRKIGRTLAEQLAPLWPVEAIRQYVGPNADEPALRAAGDLMLELGEGPSIWIELRPDALAWLSATAGFADLGKARKVVQARLKAAKAVVADPKRVALLEAPGVDALSTALEAAPGDHEVAVALADIHLSAGDPTKALVVLEKLGRPGTLVFAAQSALARVYEQVDRAQDAEALLNQVMAARMLPFRLARRAFSSRVTALEQQLIERATNGTLPADIRSKFEQASEDQHAQIFSDWLAEVIREDGGLSVLRERYTGMSDVVPLALQLGMLKLQRANALEGDARTTALAEAERVFLAIAQEGRGSPAFHLGLGQVYYRMGRAAEGKAEFDALLAEGEPFIKLNVAHTLRDLGLNERATSVATECYESSEENMQYAAAHLLFLLASDVAERKKWLLRSDKNSESVQISLLEIEAEDLENRGRLGEADKKYAEVAKRWSKSKNNSSSGANNAALAIRARYRCSGDPQRLREAIVQLERAQRLSPDSALVHGNLANVLSFAGSEAVLRTWIHLDELRGSASELSELLSVMREGPHREAQLKALRLNPILRKAQRTSEQHRALAPNDPGAYSELLQWSLLFEDEATLKRIARTLEDNELDLAQVRDVRQKYTSGGYDEVVAQGANTRIEQLTLIRSRRRVRNHAPTLAATFVLSADAHDKLARIENSIEHAQLAVDDLSVAVQTWPGIGALGESMRGQVLLGVLRLRAKNADFAELMDKHFRAEGLAGALWHVRDQPALAEALRAELQGGSGLVKILESLPVSELGLLGWELARLLQATAVTARIREDASRPVRRLGYEVGLRFDSGPLLQRFFDEVFE